MSHAEVVSVNISLEKGLPKTPIAEGRLEPDVGLVGDAHAGPWHRQLSLLAMESIDIMRQRGAEVNPGDFAENITTRGLCLHTLPVGTLLQIGPVRAAVTQIGKECHAGCAIRQKVGDCIMPRQGIFVRVLNAGTVRPGDAVRLLED
ncbi:MOSC domain containing protein [Desulfarculus baarsii DSM 2075]|uniref:MOSC domain containing protein n=1 Tax=Desulfarculus baarsii (strain ATCC 33931 / DSM 2075 / LMG 7858 / VKM B-1802 / 2st14) TaxID=644282 RepID=E1QEZ6_DESB2|nr:MOSC domain-containing protein [Desulfarculus baarsii]ADK84132.1 MOSC domain containing protein [Desulfarculus baarsii DSM 2075]